MNLSSEAWLLFGVVGFYLYDSIKLVSGNQVFLIKGLSGWRLKLPSDYLRFQSSLVFLPNPACPWTSLYKSDLFCEKSSADSLDNILQINDALRSIKPFVVLLFIQMLVFLPICVLRYGMGLLTLVVVSSIYGTVFFMVLVIFIKKIQLKLTPKRFMSLLFDCIACPPFALNAIRKITLMLPLQINVLEFATEYLEDKRKEAFFSEAIKRLDDMMLICDEDGDQHIALSKLKDKLLGASNELQ